jgi:succinyl-CoA synthetase alpha subunit
MIAYGTNVVGGVTPSKGGEWGVRGRPVFDTVQTAVETTDANASLIAVTAPDAVDAIYEAVDAGIELIICITEGIPVLDMLRLYEFLSSVNPSNRKSRLIGANCPGALTPSEANVGVIPGYIARRGNIGIVSRSSSLMYEIVYDLTNHGIGQSTIVGIGGDLVVGTRFVDILALFEDDPETQRVLLIGEIGGRMEADAAEFIKSRMTKPVVAFIAGTSAPENIRLGHAGAVIEMPEDTAAYKVEVLRAAGVRVADTLEQIPEYLS